MKIFVLLSLCFLLAMSIQAQTAPDETEEKAKVTKLTLGKEDADGNIIENPEVFYAKDIPLYCYIDLNTEKTTMVRMKVVAVKAKGLRPNTQIALVRYKTKDGETGVSFTATPGKLWAEGDYRVEIYLNAELSESKDFKVADEVKK